MTERTPRQPTEAMLNAARDWSDRKYGKPIGNDAAIGCWQAMFDAHAAAQPAPDALQHNRSDPLPISHNHLPHELIPQPAPDAVAEAAREFLAWIDYDFPSGVRAQEKAAREKLRRALAGLDPSPEPVAAAKAKFEAEFQDAQRDIARGASRTDHRFKL